MFRFIQSSTWRILASVAARTGASSNAPYILQFRNRVLIPIPYRIRRFEAGKHIGQLFADATKEPERKSLRNPRLDSGHERSSGKVRIRNGCVNFKGSEAAAAPAAPAPQGYDDIHGSRCTYVSRGLLSSSWWWPAETKGWWLKDTHIFCVNFIVSPLLSALMSCSRKWVSHDAPPVNMSKTYPWHNLCAVAASTKVLAWSLYEEGVNCFNVTQPEQGWTKSSSSLGAFLPFVLGTSPCFVEHQDHNGGNKYFLMFVLDGKEDTHIQIQAVLATLDTLCRKMYHIHSCLLPLWSNFE